MPHGHWKTTTFIGGLRLSGMTAPMMLDGPMAGEWFAAYARKVLAPTLSPGDVVILDNLPAHKSAEAREAVEAVGARLLFLPPYSPDFNPIENIFAKMKAWIRRVAPPNPRCTPGRGVRCNRRCLSQPGRCLLRRRGI